MNEIKFLCELTEEELKDEEIKEVIDKLRENGWLDSEDAMCMFMIYRDDKTGKYKVEMDTSGMML